MSRRRRLAAAQTRAVGSHRFRAVRLIMRRGDREGPCPHCTSAGSMESSSDDADPADGGGWVQAHFLRCHMCDLWVRVRTWQRADPHVRLGWDAFFRWTP